MVVHNVKASCGCTTPEWTKTPVLPGKSGTIKATFDPQNRPGNFNKTITVYSNSSTENEILRITGLVKEKTKSLEDEYPRSMDLIRLESTHLSLTKVAPDQKKTEDFRIISISDKPVTIDFDNVPAHLKIEAVPQTLQPNQEGIIRVTYDAALKNDCRITSYNVCYTKLLRMIREKVVPDVMKAMAMTDYSMRTKSNDVISSMINKGKALYYVRQMMLV